MKRALFLFALFLPFLLTAQRTLDRSAWQVAMDEDFIYTSAADPKMNARWNYTFNDTNGWNMQLFDSAQISLFRDAQGRSICRLTATRLPEPLNVPYDAASPRRYYKSGMIVWDEEYDNPQGWTRGFVYGMFEIRCRLPAGNKNARDAWPAFWMYSGPAEIDIIDNAREDAASVMSCGVIDWNCRMPANSDDPGTNPYHNDWKNIGPCNGCRTGRYKDTRAYNKGSLVRYDNAGKESIYAATKNLPAASYGDTRRRLARDGGFHTYTCVWTPQEVVFFFDGKEVFAAANTVGQCRQMHEFPMRIIAGLQVMPADNGKGKNTPDKRAAPEFSMDIDYIRVYKPKAVGEERFPAEEAQQPAMRAKYNTASFSR